MSAVVSVSKSSPASSVVAKHLRPNPNVLVDVTRALAEREPEIREVVLVADAEDELDTTILEREFPSVRVERTDRQPSGGLGDAVVGSERVPCDSHGVVIDDFAWRGAFDFLRFDELMAQTRPLQRLIVRGSDAAGVAVEVMARYQRLIGRRNDASATPGFDSMLEAHSWLFSADIPMAQADLEHALDTWQWMLRLDPTVGLVPQLAALFHDVERLEADPFERLEHRAHRVADDVQAKQDGERVYALLRSLGDATAARVRDLVTGRAPVGPDSALLDDADGLSFLSLMSPRYADHFGLAQTRRKVTFTMGRLGAAARAKVPLLRLRPDVDRLLRQG